MRAAALAAPLVAAAALAACGDGGDAVRLRHEPKRKLTYELVQREEAPHPVVGLGGAVEVTAVVDLACLTVEPDGNGHVEATVRHVKLAAPPATGAAVDTTLGAKVEGDQIGANAMAQALLPRRALVVLTDAGDVLGAQPDEDVVEHFRRKTERAARASQKALVRLAGALDAGPLVRRWWTPLAPLLRPAAAGVRDGATWRVEQPPFDTPAGPLRTTLGMTYRRDGDVAVLSGRGPIVPAAPAAADRTLDFEGGAVVVTLRVDRARGVLLSYEESSRFDFRVRDGGDPAPGSLRRTMRLLE